MADGEDPGHGAPGGENPRVPEKNRARIAAGGDDPQPIRVPVATGDAALDARLNEMYEQLERDRPQREAERARREWVARQAQEQRRVQEEEEEQRFLAGLMVTRIPTPAESRRGVREVYPDFYERVKARVEAKKRQDPQGGRRRKHKTRKHRKSRKTRKLFHRRK